jgi:hypothetical protein
MDEAIIFLFVPKVRDRTLILQRSEDHVFEVAEEAADFKEVVFALLVDDAEAFIEFFS